MTEAERAAAERIAGFLEGRLHELADLPGMKGVKLAAAIVVREVREGKWRQAVKGAPRAVAP